MMGNGVGDEDQGMTKLEKEVGLRGGECVWVGFLTALLHVSTHHPLGYLFVPGGIKWNNCISSFCFYDLASICYGL